MKRPERVLLTDKPFIVGGLIVMAVMVVGGVVALVVALRHGALH